MSTLKRFAILLIALVAWGCPEHFPYVLVNVKNDSNKSMRMWYAYPADDLNPSTKLIDEWKKKKNDEWSILRPGQLTSYAYYLSDTIISGAKIIAFDQNVVSGNSSESLFKDKLYDTIISLQYEDLTVNDWTVTTK